MKLIRQSLVMLALLALGTLWSCGGSDPVDPLAFLDRIAGTWTIGAARENGQPATFSVSGFSLTINANGSYSVTLGSLPPAAKPNYASTANNGTWSLESGNTKIAFDGNTAAAVSISNLTPTDDTQRLTGMTVTFTIDDKNATTYAFDMVKQ
jgi:hypothetical protein